MSKESMLTTDLLPAPMREPSVVMDPRRLGALQPTRLSAARSIYAKLVRENWSIDLVEARVEATGAGRMLYRIDAAGHIMHLVAFSYEPQLVDRSPRIIGSSWDIEGALIDGEVTEAELLATQEAIPRLYAGRATPETLIWFRANRSIRLFDHVIEALVAGTQPDVQRIRDVGYLLRNTGLDGNGTFGTKDFQEYGAQHPLGIPFHAQLFTAYMMREISVDLVNATARVRNVEAASVDAATRNTIAVGNGSALGLVLLTMNRPQIVHAWLSAYERIAANVGRRTIDDAHFLAVTTMLDQAIGQKNDDHTDYGVFPSGEALAIDLRVLRRVLRRLADANRHEGGSFTLTDVTDRAPSSILPEAIELFRSLLLELAPESEVDEQLRSLRVSERKQLDPLTTVAELRAQIDHGFAWVRELPVVSTEEQTRVWYKSRNSEEPRSGPSWEVPEGTNDLAVDLLAGVTELEALLRNESPNTRVGTLAIAHPHLEQVMAYVQCLAALPYAVPRFDVRDTNFVPAHIIRLFNAFCFGLEKTHDVHQRNLRGLIFEGAHFRADRDEPARDWRWEVQR
ncbi:hypothetical protein FM113_12435 [Leucobacter sp. 7(1)]|uniref:hypothetical protein n=1 Tax=Leucobacter sp. 7(1) TaxID=1255613 RepID=UPI00097F2099|nr:hypothetical protein [Leucobacter sp. 7(1)]SJN11599.1 hypothetical protein FM113_12435 [Leucobacter sp. 7(1)]